MRLSRPAANPASTAAPASSVCTCTEYVRRADEGAEAMPTESPRSANRSRSASAAAASQPSNRYITSNCGAGRGAVASVRCARGESS